MALTQSEIDQIKHLSGAVSALSHVTNSDNASRSILQQIERLAAGSKPSKPERTPIEERIATAKATSIRGIYGLVAEVTKDPESTVAELEAVYKSLGYQGFGVIPF